MPVWKNVDIKSPDDLLQFNIELNRRIRYYLRNIDVSQILFNLNDIGGTLNLSKGGTGASLTAPTSDSLMFYDLSEAAVDFASIGTGLVMSGTTLYVTGGAANYQGITASTTLTASEQGIIVCTSTGDITITLSTAITSAGVSFFLTNASTGGAKITLTPGTTARTIQYNTTEFLYPDENINLTFDGTANWFLR